MEMSGEKTSVSRVRVALYARVSTERQDLEVQLMKRSDRQGQKGGTMKTGRKDGISLSKSPKGKRMRTVNDFVQKLDRCRAQVKADPSGYMKNRHLYDLLDKIYLRLCHGNIPDHGGFGE